jgi:hypothetical protein
MQHRRPFALTSQANRFDGSFRSRAEGLVQWNVAPMYVGMRTARVFVVSTPKCGRTWLRVLLTAYDGYRMGLLPGRNLEATERKLGVSFSHDRWEHAAAPWLSLVLGRCLIPREQRRRARIVLLVRDPRDAFVSLYFELSRRKAWFSGTLEEMLLHPVFGLPRIVDVMNGWADEWRGSSRLSVLRYEDLVEDPQSGFRRFLEFALGSVDEDLLRRAVSFTSFSKMQTLEFEGYFEDEAMRLVNPSDPNSFKVRRGAVRAYEEYLSREAILLADREVARLDRVFQYPG